MHRVSTIQFSNNSQIFSEIISMLNTLWSKYWKSLMLFMLTNISWEVFPWIFLLRLVIYFFNLLQRACRFFHRSYFWLELIIRISCLWMIRNPSFLCIDLQGLVKMLINSQIHFISSLMISFPVTKNSSEFSSSSVYPEVLVLILDPYSMLMGTSPGTLKISSTNFFHISLLEWHSLMTLLMKCLIEETVDFFQSILMSVLLLIRISYFGSMNFPNSLMVFPSLRSTAFPLVDSNLSWRYQIAPPEAQLKQSSSKDISSSFESQRVNCLCCSRMNVAKSSFICSSFPLLMYILYASSTATLIISPTHCWIRYFFDFFFSVWVLDRIVSSSGMAFIYLSCSLRCQNLAFIWDLAVMGMELTILVQNQVMISSILLRDQELGGGLGTVCPICQSLDRRLWIPQQKDWKCPERLLSYSMQSRQDIRNFLLQGGSLSNHTVLCESFHQSSHLSNRSQSQHPIQIIPITPQYPRLYFVLA